MRAGSFVIGSMFGITIVLVLFGIIMIFSASQSGFIQGSIQNIYDYNIYQLMGKQLMGISLGLGLMGFFYLCDFNVWERYARVILLLSIVLLALVLTPMGVAAKGAQRWLKIGPLVCQPSELTKIAIILYLSAVWADRSDRLHSFWGVFFPLLFVGIALALILVEPDNSTTLFLCVLIVSLWFVAGGKILHMIPCFAAMCSAILVALYCKPQLWERILAWWYPDLYPDKAYHFLSARDSFARGGFWGVGLGEGNGQLGHIPEAHTDFIFSIMGEELGFIQCTLVILLFLTLIALGYWTAMRCSNPFGRLVAAGCTTALGVQAAMNLAVVMGAIPTTGIALPFISYGRSSLLVCISMIGLVMNIAKTSFDTDEKPTRSRKQARAWASA